MPISNRGRHVEGNPAVPQTGSTAKCPKHGVPGNAHTLGQLSEHAKEKWEIRQREAAKAAQKGRAA